LGWVNFTDHRVLRNTTKRRVMNRIKASPSNETLQSYLGILDHGNSNKVEDELLNIYWLFNEKT